MRRGSAEHCDQGRDGLRRYELATLAAARRLRSSYCCLAHGSVLQERFHEPVLEIALDHRAAGLDDIDVAVMDLAERVVDDATSIGDARPSRLRDLGLSEAEIMDVILAAAARCFFSKTLDALEILPTQASASSRPSSATCSSSVARSRTPEVRPRRRVETVPPGGPQATRRALARVADARAIVLVEGISDQIALATLAARRGRDLDDEGIVVVPIGGAQAIGRFLVASAPKGWTGGWRVSATRERRKCFCAVSSGPVSARTSLASTWNGSVSSFASKTLRTS